MKAYSYIFKKSMLSFLGALLIISAIDFSFNFFSEIEDINDNYSYLDDMVWDEVVESGHVFLVSGTAPDQHYPNILGEDSVLVNLLT